MSEYTTTCPIIVTKITEHVEIKTKLLELISTASSRSILENFNGCTDQISNADWHLNEDTAREYLKFVQPILIKHTKEAFSQYNLEGLVFGNFWFQQYQTNDTHGWHVHKNCHWTNVYFVELPNSDLKTQIQTVDRRSIIPFDAQEGDLVSFPSFLYHRSPINSSATQKTIISFNINFL
jgi:hypothetical protein